MIISTCLINFLKCVVNIIHYSKLILHSSNSVTEYRDLLFLAPLILLPDLLLLVRSEVVLNVERLPDLLWGLALDHLCHGLAGDVEETLDVQVVGGKDELEQCALVNLRQCIVINILKDIFN